MKRRAFNKAALAGLLYNFSVPIKSEIQRDRPTQLTCVRQPRRIVSGEIQQVMYSLTIGLGRSGSRLAAQLHGTVDQQYEALIYTETHNTPQTGSRTSCEHPSVPLTIARSGVLLLSLDETEAWSLALSWARRLREDDVYLTVAVLCVDDIEAAYSHPFTAELRQHLDCVILQDSANSTSGSQGFHPAVQSARLFFMEHGLIGWDIADLRTILGGRVTCATTSVVTSARDGNRLEDAVNACFRQLKGVAVDGGIGHWVTGINDLSVAAFSNIESHLHALPTRDLQILTSSVDLSLPVGGSGRLHVVWTLPEVSYVDMSKFNPPQHLRAWRDSSLDEGSDESQGARSEEQRGPRDFQAEAPESGNLTKVSG